MCSLIIINFYRCVVSLLSSPIHSVPSLTQKNYPFLYILSYKYNNTIKNKTLFSLSLSYHNKLVSFLPRRNHTMTEFTLITLYKGLYHIFFFSHHHQGKPIFFNGLKLSNTSRKREKKCFIYIFLLLHFL